MNIAAYALRSKLIVTALCPHFDTCGQIDLHIRIRQHACPDITSVHHDVILPGQFLLQLGKTLPDLRILTGKGRHVSNLLGTKIRIHVLSVQKNNLLSTHILNGNMCSPAFSGNCFFILRIYLL